MEMHSVRVVNPASVLDQGPTHAVSKCLCCWPLRYGGDVVSPRTHNLLISNSKSTDAHGSTYTLASYTTHKMNFSQWVFKTWTNPSFPSLVCLLELVSFKATRGGEGGRAVIAECKQSGVCKWELNERWWWFWKQYSGGRIEQSFLKDKYPEIRF